MRNGFNIIVVTLAACGVCLWMIKSCSDTVYKDQSSLEIKCKWQLSTAQICVKWKYGYPSQQSNVNLVLIASVYSFVATHTIVNVYIFS